jgi:P-type E1-E2 ATPase
MVKTLRGGEQRLISVYELLSGDVVTLETGDIISADGLLIHGSELRCDESSMTGETDAVKKNEALPFMLASCQVVQGAGVFLVISVGEHSEAGKAMKELAKPAEDTPLQEKLEELAEHIAKVCLEQKTHKYLPLSPSSSSALHFSIYIYSLLSSILPLSLSLLSILFALLLYLSLSISFSLCVTINPNSSCTLFCFFPVNPRLDSVLPFSSSSFSLLSWSFSPTFDEHPSLSS